MKKNYTFLSDCLARAIDEGVVFLKTTDTIGNTSLLTGDTAKGYSEARKALTEAADDRIVETEHRAS